MQEITINPRAVDPRKYVGKRAKTSDVGTVIDRPTIVRNSAGDPLVVMGELADDWRVIPAFLKKVRYYNGERLTRKKNPYETLRGSDIPFGFRPERHVFNFPAAPTKFNTLYPDWYKVMTSLGLSLQDMYRHYSAVTFERHRAWVAANVTDAWLIPGTIFSQGIINNSVTLDYHYDRGNVEDCWSCMAVFRSSGMLGGDLVIPELDAAFRIPDHGILLFNGQKIIHGVTALAKTRPTDYRYSVVYYTIKLMAGLGTYDEQLRRFKKMSSDRIFKK